MARECLGDDHPCWPWLLDDDNDEGNNQEGEAPKEGEDPKEEGNKKEGVEQKLEGNIFNITDSRYVVTKWIMAYVAIIIVTSVLSFIIGYPYLITGQTFRSLHSLPLPDHQVSCPLTCLCGLYSKTLPPARLMLLKDSSCSDRF